MRGALRWGILLAGLAASLGITLLLWVLTGNLWAFFLAVPFLFYLPVSGDGRGGRRAPPPAPPAAPEAPRCPECGHRPSDPAAAYCPLHGLRLQ